MDAALRSAFNAAYTPDFYPSYVSRLEAGPVEVVNLMWRHLATLPGALPWVWGVLKPLYANGTILAEAEALHSKLVLPHPPPFPPALLAAVGIVHL